MAALFRSLFLIALLFSDLTDDVCAAFWSEAPVDISLTAEPAVLPLSMRNQQDIRLQIELPPLLFSPLDAPQEPSPASRSWLGETEDYCLSSVDFSHLYKLKSLQI
jgi:hypothetical protein